MRFALLAGGFLLAWAGLTVAADPPAPVSDKPDETVKKDENRPAADPRELERLDREIAFYESRVKMHKDSLKRLDDSYRRTSDSRSRQRIRQQADDEMKDLEKDKAKLAELQDLRKKAGEPAKPDVAQLLAEEIGRARREEDMYKGIVQRTREQLAGPVDVLTEKRLKETIEREEKSLKAVQDKLAVLFPWQKAASADGFPALFADPVPRQAARASGWPVPRAAEHHSLKERLAVFEKLAKSRSGYYRPSDRPGLHGGQDWRDRQVDDELKLPEGILLAVSPAELLSLVPLSARHDWSRMKDWTPEIIDKCNAWLKEKGVPVRYEAEGAIRQLYPVAGYFDLWNVEVDHYAIVEKALIPVRIEAPVKGSQLAGLLPGCRVRVVGWADPVVRTDGEKPRQLNVVLLELTATRTLEMIAPPPAAP
ncbi:MAG: hypothetical protein BIFFINMI_03554 [Phycisphaerae bacterium]|nr:hypothetical protein [Phycisphaerae bacterium]